MNWSARLVTLGILSSIVSCKPFDPSLLTPTATAFSPKLPAMEEQVQGEVRTIVGKHDTSIAPGSNDLAHFFEREVREKLSDPYGDKKGTLELKVLTINQKQRGLGWSLLFSATLMTGYFIGIPYGNPHLEVTTQLDVLDNKRRLLATYQANGEANAVGSIFSSTNYADPSRVLYLQAVRQSLDKIVTTMQPDIARLNAQLK